MCALEQQPLWHRRRAWARAVVVSSLLVALAGCGLSSTIGGVFYRGAFALRQTRAGLADQQVKVGDHVVAYVDSAPNDKSKMPPIVMVHGFSADKSNWFAFARHFTSDHRVIALDLPPFGDSTHDPNRVYTVADHVTHLRGLLDALGIERAHLVGNSMGGHTVTIFSALHPERVVSLALFDPAGVEAPELSDAHRLLKETGENPFVIEDRADVDRFFGLLFVEQPFAPAPALDHFADKERARSADIARWGDDYLGNWVDAEPVLGRIDAPTLVVWGDTDRILHPSTAPIFEKKIKDATLVIMKDCGHLPMLERPDESASHYARFLVDQRLR